MAANHVGSLTPDNFGNFAISAVQAVSIAATGNASITLPIVGTSYIVRRITVSNANANIANANVVVLTSSDGNASNAVSNVTVLSSVTSNSTYQDIGLVAATGSTVYNASSLFVKINTAVSNGTCDISVYGDIVTI